MKTLSVECFCGGPNSFYPEKIMKGKPLSIKKWPNKHAVNYRQRIRMQKKRTKNENLRCENLSEYGKGIRQENVRSKTKELSGSLPYALSVRPTLITVSSEECQDVTTACQIVDANGTLRAQARNVRVQTIYYKQDIIIPVRHDQRREKEDRQTPKSKLLYSRKKAFLPDSWRAISNWQFLIKSFVSVLSLFQCFDFSFVIPRKVKK